MSKVIYPNSLTTKWTLEVTELRVALRLRKRTKYAAKEYGDVALLRLVCFKGLALTVHVRIQFIEV